MSLEFKTLLLQAPESQLSSVAKESIKKWSESPSALQILETLDLCIHGSLASGFSIQVLNILLNTALDNENTSLEELAKSAHWRKPKE